MLLYVYLDHRNANYSAYIEVVSVELYVEEISAKLSVKEISIISRVADILSYMNSFGLFLMIPFDLPYTGRNGYL